MNGFQYTPLELLLMKITLIVFIVVGAVGNLGVILAVVGKWYFYLYFSVNVVLQGNRKFKNIQSNYNKFV